MRKLLRPIYFAGLDWIDWMQRFHQGKLQLPPRSLRDVGGSDFEATGLEFVEHFKKLGRLKPHENILEIGCGSGRIAMPLARYMAGQGHYWGAEIIEKSVRWCQKNITRRYPNFEFLHAELYNKRYNPKARHLAKDYVFPFSDRYFDFIYLTSVFTHVLPEDLENYVREIARMLKPEGRVFSTFFLLNQTQATLAKQGQNQINFQFERGIYSIRNEEIPESAVAYQEDYLLELWQGYGFVIQKPIIYGWWSGREDGLSLQDFMIATKRD